MAYRRFTDSHGIRWRVWDVFPSPLDRRLAVRRIRATRGHEVERRASPERRTDMRRSRLFFSPHEKAWLCFESPEARRRLTPVPDGWALRTDAELEELCGRAEEKLPSGHLGRSG
jgi:hypothetical protein